MNALNHWHMHGQGAKVYPPSWRRGHVSSKFYFLYYFKIQNTTCLGAFSRLFLVIGQSVQTWEYYICSYIAYQRAPVGSPTQNVRRFGPLKLRWLTPILQKKKIMVKEGRWSYRNVASAAPWASYSVVWEPWAYFPWPANRSWAPGSRGGCSCSTIARRASRRRNWCRTGWLREGLECALWSCRRWWPHRSPQPPHPPAQTFLCHVTDTFIFSSKLIDKNSSSCHLE